MPILVAANQLYMLPFPVPERQSYSGIAVSVAAAAVGDARLGVYQDGGGYPEDLVIDLGEISTGATGVQAVSYNFTLYKGLYWAAAIFSAAPTMGSLSPAQLWSIGMDATLTTFYVALSSAQAYGALPSVLLPAALFPVSGEQPLIALRKSL